MQWVLIYIILLTTPASKIDDVIYLWSLSLYFYFAGVIGVVGVVGTVGVVTFMFVVLPFGFE